MPLYHLKIGKSLTKVRTGAPMMLSTTANKRHHGTALAFKTRLCFVGSQEGCVNDSRVYSVVCWLGLLSCQRKECKQINFFLCLPLTLHRSFE